MAHQCDKKLYIVQWTNYKALLGTFRKSIAYFTQLDSAIDWVKQEIARLGHPYEQTSHSQHKWLFENAEKGIQCEIAIRETILDGPNVDDEEKWLVYWVTKKECV